MSKIVKIIRRFGKKIASKVRSLVDRCRRQGNLKSKTSQQVSQPAHQVPVSVQPPALKTELASIQAIYTIDRPLPFKAINNDIGRLFLERLFIGIPFEHRVYEELNLDLLFVEGEPVEDDYPQLSLEHLFPDLEEALPIDDGTVQQPPQLSHSYSTDSMLSSLMETPRDSSFQSCLLSGCLV